MNEDEDELLLGEFETLETALKFGPDPSFQLQQLENFIVAARQETNNPSEPNLTILLPKYVQLLLKRSDFEEEAAPRVNGFFQVVLGYIISKIPNDIPELLECISRIFNGTHSPFYATYGDHRRDHWESAYVSANVISFRQQEGFGAIITRLKRTNPKPPLPIVKLLLKVCVKSKDYLPPDHLKALVQEIYPTVSQQILSLTDDELKNEDKNVISEISSSLDALLRNTTPKFSEIMDKFNLDINLKFFRSPYLEKRLSGLNDIKEMISQVVFKDEYAYKSNHDHHHHNPSLSYMADLWINASFMLNWILQNKIMESLYGHNMHPELIRRGTEVPRFLIMYRKLTRTHLDLIWDASLGKHETVRHTIYNTISDLASKFTPEEFDYIQEKIASIPPKSYDSQTISLIRSFTIHALQHVGKIKQWYGLGLLWNALQDPNVTGDVAFQSLTAFLDLLGWRTCSPQRNNYLVLCLQNLKTGQSVPQTFKIIHRLIESEVEYQSKPRGSDVVAELIESLVQREKLFELFFDDLRRYKKVVAARLAQPFSSSEPSPRQGDSEFNLNNMIFEGKMIHIHQIQERLNFLLFLLERSNIQLSKAHTEILWNCLILNATTQQERNFMFSWFEREKHSTRDLLLSMEAVEDLFNNKFPALDLSSLSYEGFLLFDYFFKYLNQRANKLDLERGQYVTKSFDLFGESTLWKIALNVSDQSVGNQAIFCLTHLQTHVAPELYGQLAEQRELFVKKCMENLSNAAKAIQVKDAQGLSVNEIAVDRCLTLLKTLIDECESNKRLNIKRHGSGRGPVRKIEVFLPGRIETDNRSGEVREGKTAEEDKFVIELHSYDTVGKMRKLISEKVGKNYEDVHLFYFGHPLKSDHESLKENNIIHKVEANIISPPPRGDKLPSSPLDSDPMNIGNGNLISPSELLSDHKYFSELFRILELNEQIGKKVWQLLMFLPTNKDLYDALFTFSSQVLDFSVSSPFKLLYSLQIIDSFISPPPTPASPVSQPVDQTWCQRFQQSGGVRYLIKTFMSKELTDSHNIAKKVPCLGLLLKILHFFLIGPSNQQKVSPLRDIQDLQSETNLFDFINQLNQVVYDISKHIADKTNPSNIRDEEIEAVHYAMQVEVGCFLHPSDPGLIQRIFRSSRSNKDDNEIPRDPNFSQWLYTVLLETPEPNIRSEVSIALLTLCDTIGSAGLHSLLLEELLSFLPQIKSESTTVAEYFDLIRHLIKKLGDDIQVQNLFKKLLNDVWRMIREHPILESRHSEDEDKVLIGLLRLAIAIIEKSPATLEENSNTSEIVNEVFHKLLFELPTVANDGYAAPPKCKSKNARERAFELLHKLCSQSIQNYQLLLPELKKQHQRDPSSHPNHHVWNYVPNSYDKPGCGYVGLRNLGATCYMNSLFQQFFMIPKFRYGLFSHTDHSENKSDSLLYQMQFLFAYLQESEKKYYDTTGFCASYKDSGQSMDTGIQMDVDEFFNILFDKLENLFKGTKTETLLKDIFGGTLSNQVISRECEDVSEREEGFFTLSIEIKNKKSIEESLEMYVLGDMLEGDNKYHCSNCNKKVDALKRTCIKKLPNTLIIHLKRFEFDLEMMRRTKVNDYCSFPLILNMEAYTKEGIARREAEQSGASASSTGSPLSRSLRTSRSGSAIPENTDYEYELMGILVHKGTAESGHYYSFIRERTPRVKRETGEDERQWYHFNDTHLEPFDIRNLEKECFGGNDTTYYYDHTLQKQTPRTHARIYNAYMLFYERVQKSSSPQTLPPQEQSGLVPRQIYQDIWNENVAFLRDKTIYDSDYYNFLYNFLQIDTKKLLAQSSPSTGPLVSKITVEAVQFATYFLFETLVHGKDRSKMKPFAQWLETNYSYESAYWFISHMVSDHSWIKKMLLLCPNIESREVFTNLVIHSCKLLRPLAKQSDSMEIEKVREVHEMETESISDLERQHKGEQVIHEFIDVCISFLKEAHLHWRYFAQYFKLLSDFASIDSWHSTYLFNKNLISQLISFILSDQASGKGQPASKKTKMGDKYATPNLTYLLALLSTLVRRAQLPLPTGARPSPTLHPEPLTLSETDYLALVEPAGAFYQKVLEDNINTPAVIEIIRHLIWENLQHSHLLINSLCVGVNNIASEYFKPYFETLTAIFTLEDSAETQRARLHHGLQQFLQVIDDNLRYRAATTLSIQYFVSLSKLIRPAKIWLFEQRSRFYEPWLLNYVPSIREATEELFLSLLAGHPDSPPMTAAPVDSSNPQEGPSFMNYVVLLQQDLLQRLSILQSYLRIETASDVKNNDSSGFKVASFFRLLKYCFSHSGQKIMLQQYWNEYSMIFIANDRLHLEFDENKREIVSCLCEALTDTPTNVQLVIASDQFIAALFDFFISISPTDRSTEYNKSSLVAFYSIILLCCRHSRPFLERLMMHHNFDWASHHLFLEGLKYHNVGGVIFDIMKEASQHVEYRRSHLSWAITLEQGLQCYRNLFRFWDLLIKEPDDFNRFVQTQGLQVLTKTLKIRMSNPNPNENEEISYGLNFLLRCFSLIPQAFSKPPQLHELLDFWSSRKQLIPKFIQYLAHPNANKETLRLTIEALQQLLNLDSTHLTELISFLHELHRPLHLGHNNNHGTYCWRRSPCLQSPNILAYYSFIANLLAKGLQYEEIPRLISMSIELALMILKESIEPVEYKKLDLPKPIHNSQPVGEKDKMEQKPPEKDEMEIEKEKEEWGETEKIWREAVSQEIMRILQFCWESNGMPRQIMETTCFNWVKSYFLTLFGKEFDHFALSTPNLSSSATFFRPLLLPDCYLFYTSVFPTIFKKCGMPEQKQLITMMIQSESLAQTLLLQPFSQYILNQLICFVKLYRLFQSLGTDAGELAAQQPRFLKTLQDIKKRVEQEKEKEKELWNKLDELERECTEPLRSLAGVDPKMQI